MIFYSKSDNIKLEKDILNQVKKSLLRKEFNTLGTIYEAKCSCGYETKLYLGAGSNACSLKYITRLLTVKEWDNFHMAFENNQVKTFQLMNAAYTCRECKILETGYLFTYQLNTGQIIKVHGNCSKCDKPVQIQEKEPIHCPECGEKLSLNNIGEWD